MKNLQIRVQATEAGVRLWEIAEEMGITDSSFSRKLRRELDPVTKDRIFRIIADLSQRREGTGGDEDAHSIQGS